MKTLGCPLILLGRTWSVQAKTIKGAVHSNNEPLPLATVCLAHSDLGTAADANGRFRMEMPAPGTYTLVVSAVGYQPAQIEVTGTEGATKLVAVTLNTATYEAGVRFIAP